jgi:hypothetical protein
MATLELSPDTEVYAWVRSIMDGVRTVTGRDVRWDQTAILTDEPELLYSRLGRKDFGTETDRVVLSREDHESATNAISFAGGVARSAIDPAQLRGLHAGLVEATGNVASQARRMTGGRAQEPSRFTVSETHLDAAFAGLDTQDNLRELWPVCESGRLMPARADVGPGVDGYFGRDHKLATAARDLVREVHVLERIDIRELRLRAVATLEGSAVPDLTEPQDRPHVTAADYRRTVNGLIRMAPDHRWQALVQMLPLADQLNQHELRDLAQMNLRVGFKNAIGQDDPAAGTHKSAVAAVVQQVALDVKNKVEAAQAAAAAGIDPRVLMAADTAAAPAHRAPGHTRDGEQAATVRSPGKNGQQNQGLGG